MNESRGYEQDQRYRRNDGRNDERPYDLQGDRMSQQWRDQGDGRFDGTERRGDDRSWEWDHDRGGRGNRESYSGNGGDSWNRGRDGGYRAGDGQGRMAGGFDSDRWMDSPRPVGDRDSSRAWRGTGAGSFEGYDNDPRGRQRSASQGGGAYGGPTEWGGSYAGAHRESFSGRGPKGYRRSDDRIREEVSDRLTDDHSLDASEIEVEVKDGEVTLKGTVSDRQQKRRAEDLAESCSGVSDVTNSIRVSRGDQSNQGRDSQSQSSQRGNQSGSQKSNAKGSSADASM